MISCAKNLVFHIYVGLLFSIIGTVYCEIVEEGFCTKDSCEGSVENEGNLYSEGIINVDRH